jgi:hypothetical protein
MSSECSVYAIEKLNLIKTCGSESRIWWGPILNNSAQADTKFLRRIFLALVLLTIAAGGMVGFTTAQATTDSAAACTVSCK